MSPANWLAWIAVGEQPDGGVRVVVGGREPGRDEDVPGALDRPGAHRDRAVQRRRTDAQVRGLGQRRRPGEQVDGGVRQPGAPRALRRRDEALHAVARVRREPSRTLEPRRGDRVRAAGAGAGRGVVEHGRDGVVGAGRRLAEVPGAAVDVVGRHRAGERPVDRAEGGRAGLRVDARADEVVPERHAVGPDGEQLRLRGLVEVGHGDAEQRARPGDRGEVTATGRRDQQGGPGRRRELVRPARRTSWPGRRAPGSARPAGRASTPVVGELEQGERVASGRRQQVRAGLVGEAVADRAGQRRGVVVGQAPERELRQACRTHHRRRLVADREQHDDGVGGEPSGREAQGLRRRRVEQVGIVDDHRQRSVLGHAAQQAEHRGADREPLAAGSRPQRERRAQRLGLRCRDGVEQAERRAAGAGAARRTAPPARRRSPRPAARACPTSDTDDAASSSRAVLPIPASPVSTSVPLSPTRAAATSVAMAWRSRSRPTSTRRV